MNKSKLSKAFVGLPSDLSEALINSYTEIKRNFVENRHEPSELNGGKFCEAVFRVLEWKTSSPKKYTPIGTTLPNFGDSLKQFHSLPNTVDYSLRYQIPKALDSIYDIRNHRGVGHLAKVSPNYMDSVYIVSASDWIMAELVRTFRKVSTIEATKIVSGLVSKKVPLIWEVDDIKRVLDSNLSFKEETLVILYQAEPGSESDFKLAEWTGYSNPTLFKKYILEKLDKERFIYYNKKTGEATISPTGIKHVEDNIDLHL